MVTNIEVCFGHNCIQKGPEELVERLERLCVGLPYEIAKKGCTGHCSKGGPTVRFGNDIYFASTGIFLQSDRKLRNFLENYQSVTSIEGYCNRAEKGCYGVAVDIGTTVIKASLNDLDSGAVLGEASTRDKQSAYGTTVQHRWNYFHHGDDSEKNLKTLSDVVQKTVADLIDYLKEKSGASISKIVMAGNTAMTYFYLKKDPGFALKKKKDYTEIKYKNGKVLLPCVFKWVGGDIVSGMTAHKFDKFDRNVMLIDLGTNGEVALSQKKAREIFVAAASAGPAFEGEGFKCGMPAMNGAICAVSSDENKIQDRFQYEVMGQKEPLGLCGSGMLDLLAEMLANKIMDRNGTLDEKYEGEFVLVKRRDKNRQISVTQDEINYFTLSKAAIFATVQTVLKVADLSCEDLDVIYVAGGFGNMNIEKAQFIGLLPPSDKYEFVGNTSLAGAQSCLKKENLERAERIANSAIPLYLSGNDEISYIWGEDFKAARFFPHRDIELFDRIIKKYMKKQPVKKRRNDPII